jgi:hypothetical protein
MTTAVRILNPTCFEIVVEWDQTGGANFSHPLYVKTKGLKYTELQLDFLFWPLTLREESKLKISENRVRRKTSGPMREEVTRG